MGGVGRRRHRGGAVIPICEHCNHDYIDRTDHSNCDGDDTAKED